MEGNADPNAGYDPNAVEYNANHSIDWYNQQNQFYAQQQQQQYYAEASGWPGAPPFGYGQQQFYPHGYDPQQMPYYQGQEMYQDPSQQIQNYEAQTAAVSAPEAPGGTILSGAAARKLAAAQSQQYQAAMQPQFIPQMPPPPFYPMQPGQMSYPYFEQPAFVITQQPQLNPFMHPPQFQHASSVSQVVPPSQLVPPSSVVPPSQVIPLTGVLMQPKTAVKGNKYDESLTKSQTKGEF